MAIALVTSTVKATGENNNQTTSAIDTTGATLIVVSMSWYAGSDPTTTFTDSKSNSWTPLTARSSSLPNTTQLWYCVAPSVGSGHTWTGGGDAFTYPVLSVLAFSGTAASPFDQESAGGNSGSATSIQPGSITPAEDNEVFITSVVVDASSSLGLDSGFTANILDFSGGVNVGGGSAYKIQTSASAENPTWGWFTNTQTASAMATFKELAGGGGGGSSASFRVPRLRPRIFAPGHAR